jgi:hypothetical protein
MAEFGKEWDTDRLTADLASHVRIALQEAFSHASREAYQWFLERYDLPLPWIEWQGRRLRFKAVSRKTFLTSFGTISLARRLYQADPGGPSYVLLDHLWDMEGHFATEDIRQAVCFAMAHMTAEETEQLLQLCSLFRRMPLTKTRWSERSPSMEPSPTRPKDRNGCGASIRLGCRKTEP